MMSRRINIYGVCFVSGLCVLLLLASHRFSGNINYRPVPDFRRTIQSLSADNQLYTGQNPNTAVRNKLALQQKQIEMSQNQTFTIDDIINLQRNKIAMEMADYKYPNGKFGVKAEKLSDLTLETGGTPLRNIIITTWRSGSTFVGDILNSIPGNYYHYEPLLNYDIVQIRGPPYAKTAIKNLKKLLNCDYEDMYDYLEYGQEHIWLFTHNERLWDQCLDFPQVCWNSTFLSRFCKLFPIQSMKVVRLRLKLAEELLGEDG